MSTLSRRRFSTLDRLQKHSITTNVNASKSEFDRDKIKYLGHISTQEVHSMKFKVETITSYLTILILFADSQGS